MTDILIKGGKIVDGTGKAAWLGDVRVSDGTIAEIGANLSTRPGERQFDAKDCVVTPGFIEPHTHYDGIMWWQPDLDPLPGHGVSTIVMGDCGFTCAPLSDDPDVRLEMVKIFSFFEDIPVQPFLENVKWDWGSWSEYKESMQRNVQLPTNVAAYVGHIAIRFAVMGMDAWDRAATSDEINQMAAMLEDAMRAGALGLSTNLLDHDRQDRPIPTLKADDAEFLALFDVLDRHPNAQLEIALDIFIRLTGLEQMERMARLTEGKKIRVQWGGVPTMDWQVAAGMHKPYLEFHERMKAEGRDYWTVFAHVAPTVTATIQHSLTWSQGGWAAWNEVVEAEGDAAKEALLRDPSWRTRAQEQLATGQVFPQGPFANPEQIMLIASENGHGPVHLSAKDYAAETGLHYSDALAEWFLNNGLQSAVHLDAWHNDEPSIVNLFHDDFAIGNVNDTGAHGQMFCGVGQNMMLFTDYVKRGDLSLEQAVFNMTGKPAKHFGFADRGKLEVGMRADIAVFNLDEIQVAEWERIYDVPAGEGKTTWRWTRPAAPTRLTLVNGVSTFENGAPTGARPGAFTSPAREDQRTPLPAE